MQKRQTRLQLHRITLRHLDPADPLYDVRGGYIAVAIDTSCGEACTCEPCGGQVVAQPVERFEPPIQGLPVRGN